MHEETGHQKRFHRGDEKRDCDGHGHAVEMNGVHEHRQNRSENQGSEDGEVDLLMLGVVMPVVMPGSVSMSGSVTVSVAVRITHSLFV